MISHTEFEAATEGNDAFSCVVMRRAQSSHTRGLLAFSECNVGQQGVEILVYIGK